MTSAIGRVRITSDGRLQGTKVIDLETGLPLHEVTRIDIQIPRPGRPNTATIEVLAPAVDVVADATIVHRCARCGQSVPPAPEVQ